MKKIDDIIVIKKWVEDRLAEGLVQFDAKVIHFIIRHKLFYKLFYYCLMYKKFKILIYLQENNLYVN